VPAITAVIDGVARVGIDESEWPLILGPAKKVGERELGLAVAQRWPVGATTVSSSLLLAARAGIRVFSTGGIGGVHRGAETSGDISSDLGAIAQHHVVTVCAGAKSFLDLPRTLEYLETLSVPVLGLGCDFFPEFTVERGDLKIPARVETIKELAEIVRANDALGRNGGILACVPVPKKDGLLKSFMDEITATALNDANNQGITGAAADLQHLGQVGGKPRRFEQQILQPLGGNHQHLQIGRGPHERVGGAAMQQRTLFTEVFALLQDPEAAGLSPGIGQHQFGLSLQDQVEPIEGHVLVQNHLIHDLMQQSRRRFALVPVRDSTPTNRTATAVLKTELRSLTKDNGDVTSDYVEYWFALEDNDGTLLWSGMYETKRASAVDVIYQ
jgi:pseudouridine-5'-phosphate glycosidase